MRLSVVIIAKNEERKLNACMESVKWIPEIILLDNGSSDKTVEIAKKYTDKIFTFNNLSFSSIRNKGMEKSTGDWVLFIDADERILDGLKNEILQIIESSTHSAFAISRKNIIFGQEKKYGPFWPDWVIRLLKKSDFEEWVGEIHEQPKFKGSLGYTKNSLIHLTHRDLEQIVLKSLAWSKIEAELRIKAHHPQMTAWRFIRIFLSETFNQGIVRKGFFNGTVGVMDSLLQAFSMYMTYVRLWEFQQPKSLEQVYEEIDQKLISTNFKY